MTLRFSSILFCALTMLTYTQCTAHPNDQTRTLIQSTQPEDIAIAVDLHNVLLLESKTGMVKKGADVFWQMPLKDKARCLKRLALFGLNKVTHYNKEKLAIEHAAVRGSNEQLNTDMLKLINPHVLDEQMVTLLRSLKQRGHLLFVYSNIGHLSWEQYVQEYPVLTTLFDGVRVCSPRNGYTTKEFPAAAQQLRTMIVQQCKKQQRTIPKHTIIVDDSMSKIGVAVGTNNASAATNYSGYLFSDRATFARDFKLA